ncbi:MAG: hypothetical protein NTU73_10080 [Ignavibacteriae bacterium]|nr:hypothetical protein [Ignavibacteriota bacterium]
MDKYLVVQNVVDASNNNSFSVSTIIRIIEAINEEEAIGKFVKDTETLQHTRKFKIDCWKLDELAILK